MKPSTLTCTEAAAAVIERAGKALAAKARGADGLDRKKLDALQPQAFLLARWLAESSAARELARFAEEHGSELQRALARFYAAEVAARLAGSLRFSEEQLGLEGSKELAALDACAGEIAEALSNEELDRSFALLSSRGRELTGPRGLDEAHDSLRQAFNRFGEQKIAPLAESIHRHDRLVPDEVLQGLAELGVFGISIPEEFGGCFVDHLAMVVATEELSRVSLGAGGSIITRPEICAKAILAGGTAEQKKKWLPLIASGEKLVGVAVTEPDAGSDVAAVKVSAKRVPGGYLINGEKTWCTFGGRADLLILLARTGSAAEGHKGLTLFLVEKPGLNAEQASAQGGSEYIFSHKQPGGGQASGKAIPTIGYRGMHSFSVSFEDYLVPEENRIGKEGEGFALQMKGFAGGRIQTAARALGVMEAAFLCALDYARDRKVFGQPLWDFPLSRQKLVRMASKILAAQRLTYHVASLMDEEKGGMEASLVKLLACSDAEWVTREAMQLHGGMGYSEEFAVSRYWQDARVLSIFEGAEEVLALSVIARQYLQSLLKEG